MSINSSGNRSSPIYEDGIGARMQMLKTYRGPVGRCSQALAALALMIATHTLVGCAPEVQRKPVDLVPLPPSDSVGIYTFARDVTVTPAAVYSRTIAAGSQWKLIGRIPAGEVYRPVSGVFTIESAHVHEAGLVIWQGKLTGFYMLVERAFVPSEPPIAVQLVQGVK